MSCHYCDIVLAFLEFSFGSILCCDIISINIGLNLVLINIVLSINISMLFLFYQYIYISIIMMIKDISYDYHTCLFYPISLLRSNPAKGSNFGSGPGKSPRKSWKS